MKRLMKPIHYHCYLRGSDLKRCLSFDTRTVMKTGLESVKAALRSYFNSAAEDLEKTEENLKLGQFTHSREQPRGVTQIINYTTFALLPVLSSLFEHIGQNMFGEDLICTYSLLLLRPMPVNEPLH